MEELVDKNRGQLSRISLKGELGKYRNFAACLEYNKEGHDSPSLQVLV